MGGGGRVSDIADVRYNVFFFYLACEATGTAVTPGLLCQPRVIVKMIVEKQIRFIAVLLVLLHPTTPHRF
jgi:hypothetical protein